MPPSCIAYASQEVFKKELERLQEHQTLAPQGVDKMAKWCNSFVIVPKPNGTEYLCLDPARLNQVLIRPVHRGPTINDILPKLTNVHYMIICSAGYHNLKLD